MEPTSDRRPSSDELPPPALFWRWVGQAVRHYIGWVLVAVGALAIVLGYLGVANNALVAKQLPYLISGGIFGLGLVAIGSFYLMTEELRSDSGRLDRLERMVAELHLVLLARADAPAREQLAAARGEAGRPGSVNGTHAGATTDADPLVALPDSQRFHRASCRMVEGKSDVAKVTAADIDRRDLQPCTMCDPVAELQG